jgi:hypothetical protein
MPTSRSTHLWPLVVMLLAALACTLTGTPTATPPPPSATPIPVTPDTPGGDVRYDELVADVITDEAGDSWNFDGVAGDVVTIAVHAPELDSRLELIAPDGGLLAEDDDSGPGANPLIKNLVLPEAGAYQIKVLGEGSANGAYSLSLTLGELAGGPPDTDGGFLRYDEAVRDQVTDGAVDEWVFEGAAGDEITIVLYSDEFDTELEVLDPDGATVFRDDDGGAGQSSLIQGLRLASDGTFTILAQGRGGAGGAYLLTLVLSNAALIEGTDGGPIEIGASVEDAISDNDGDAWTFSGEAGDSVTIALNGDGLDTMLELYGPDGTLVAADDDSGPDLSSRLENARLPVSGEYTILALGYDGQYGYYTLSLEPGEPPEARGGLAVGQTISDTLLSTAGAVYSFEGQAGITVSVYLQSRDFDATLELLGPDGALEASDEDSGLGSDALLQSIALPAGGTYSILVFTASGFGGDYALTLLAGPFVYLNDTPGGVIALGQTVTDTVIEAPGDTWTFTGAAGDWVTIALTSDEFDTFVELRGPGGELIADDDDDGPDLSSLIENVQLPAAGTYTIVARGFGDGGGVYTLSLNEGEEVLPLGELSYGETVTANLSSSSGDTWTFAGTSGEVVTINLSSQAFDTVLELRAPNGQLLASDDDGGADTNSLLEEVELPETGTYTVVVRSFGGGAGEYALTLDQAGGGASGHAGPRTYHGQLGALHAVPMVL